VKGYGEAWLGWRIAIQLKWREGKKLIKASGQYWGKIMVASENGLLLVIMALTWWGRSGQGKKWDAAVEELKWCVKDILDASTKKAVSKRKRATHNTGIEPKVTRNKR